MSQYILVRIQAIQDELEAVKKLVNNQATKSRNKTKIKGLWRYFEVTDQDLEEAEKVIFKNVLEWDQ